MLSSQTTSSTYSAGQLTSTTNANNQTVSYLYNYAGQVACVAYPVSSSSSCGTLGSPATGSTTDTIVTRSYDSTGRLSSVTDWLGDTTSYAYADAWIPNTPTTITYPSSTSLSATYGYDNDGNTTSLSAGTSISDAWTYNADSEVATSKTNGSTSAAVGYNANKQITAAANLATSTSNDTDTIAANGEITSDTPPSGAATDFTYNAADELCNTSTTSVACGTNSSTGTAYAYATNGERASATPYVSGVAQTSTNYSWNPYGELCNVSSASSTSCASTPSTGSSYTYNGVRLRMSTTTTSSGTVTSTTDSTWDSVTGGSTPLNINDTTTTSSGTSNVSYIYGDLLSGGTAPVEQITTTSGGAAADFLVTNQTGVQGVYGSTGSSLEQAQYSLYGKQTITSGSDVTPFGFQGSHADSTGLIYLINRYYDPSTDQFLMIDPDLVTTDQPYLFTSDDPLNSTDPLGMKGWYCIDGQSRYFSGNKFGKIGPGKCAPTQTGSQTVGTASRTYAAVQQYVAAATISELSNGKKSQTINGYCAAALVFGGTTVIASGGETFAVGRAAAAEADDLASAGAGTFLMMFGVAQMYGGGVAYLNAWGSVCRN